MTPWGNVLEAVFLTPWGGLRSQGFHLIRHGVDPLFMTSRGASIYRLPFGWQMVLFIGGHSCPQNPGRKCVRSHRVRQCVSLQPANLLEGHRLISHPVDFGSWSSLGETQGDVPSRGLREESHLGLRLYDRPRIMFNGLLLVCCMIGCMLLYCYHPNTWSELL